MEVTQEQHSETNKQTIQYLCSLPEDFFDITHKTKSPNDLANSHSLREDYLLSLPELLPLFPNTTSQGLYHIIKNKYKLAPIKIGRTNFLKPENVRTILYSQGYKFNKEILSVPSTKGGIGKTLFSTNFAIRAAQFGAKVLLIDADQQGNTTQSFGLDGDEFYCLYDAISEEKDCKDIGIENTIVPITEHLHLVPSGTTNSLLERYLALSVPRLDLLFQKLLSSIIDDYDYIVFDCSPALGNLNTAIILGSSRIVIPLVPNNFSYKGVATTLKWIRDTTVNYNGSKSTRINIFFNQFKHTSIAKHYMTKTATEPLLKDFMLDSTIRACEEVVKVTNKNESVFDNLKKSNIRDDLDELFKEISGLDQIDLNQSQENIH